MRFALAALVTLATLPGCSRACGSSDAGAGADAGKLTDEIIGGYRVTPADGPGVIASVPAIDLSAWLPEKPSRSSGTLSLKNNDSLPQEELAVSFISDPGVGCSISWLRYEGRPAPDVDEILKAHATRLHASVLRSRDVTFGDGRAKEAELSMAIPPNVGTVRVRVALHREHVVLGHTYVHQSDRLDPVVARCLSSITLERESGTQSLDFVAFTKSPDQTIDGKFVQVVAGKDNTCARTDKGEVYCWGDNAFTSKTKSASDLGAPQRTTPHRVHGKITNAIDVDIAASHGCAVEAAGTASCWTDETVDATSGANEQTLFASSLGVKDAVAVRASVGSSSHFCFVHRDGHASCSSFQPGAPLNAPNPVKAVADVKEIAVADSHTCALDKKGAVVCWGSNLLPAPILSGATAVTAGSAVSCAIRNDRAVCWGSNDSGQATGIAKGLADRPTEVAGLPPVRRVVAGVYHSCAVTHDGRVRCWGDNRFDQRGPGGTTADIEGVERATDVAVGEFHTCALVASGDIFCWGRNQRGQLGDGTAADRKTPVRVSR